MVLTIFWESFTLEEGNMVFHSKIEPCMLKILNIVDKMGFKRKNIILKVIKWVFREEKTLRPEGFPLSQTKMAHRDR